MARRQEKSSYSRITYPTGCKELNEELSKEELLKRLKVSQNIVFCLIFVSDYGCNYLICVCSFLDILRLLVHCYCIFLSLIHTIHFLLCYILLVCFLYMSIYVC
jgi:hypothetical protein